MSTRGMELVCAAQSLMAGLAFLFGYWLRGRADRVSGETPAE